MIILALILAYLLGSVPTALLVGRHLRGIDLREHGSRNLGATNAFRVLGRRYGVAVLFIDIIKGLAAVVLIPSVLGMRNATPATEMLIGAAAILGHVYSPWVGFRGGKGVATAVGVFLAVATTEMLILLVVGIAVIGVTGYVSAGSLLGALLLPILLYIFKQPPLVLFVGEIIALLVIYRHRANIGRLIDGTELKFNESTSDDRPIPTVSPDATPER
jgi:acyl phosphate:glycerol-3-phosphate acyltransferase